MGKKGGNAFLRWGALGGALVFLISFVVYLKTLAPTVFVGDSGEFITDAYVLGIPHPSGYPLYVILGKLFTVLIPYGSIAFRVNIMSAFFAALAVVATYFMIKLILRSNIIAFTSSLILAFSRTLWSQALIAEVYALGVFFLAILILITLLWREKRWDKLPYLFALTYGLGLTNHLMLGIFIPAFIYFFWTNNRDSIKKKQISVMIVLFLLGLSIYLYLPIRAKGNPLFYSGKPDTVGELIKYVTGERYHNELFRISFEFALKNAVGFLSLLLKEFSIYLWWLIPLGALKIFKKDKQFFIFLSLIFILDIVYTTHFDLYYVGEVEVYFIPAYITSLIWMAYGIKYLIEAIQQKLEKSKSSSKISLYLTSLLLISLPFVPLTVNYNLNDRSNDYVAYDFGLNIFKTVGENAVIFVGRDNEMFTTTYLKLVEGRRPDIILTQSKQEILTLYEESNRPVYSTVELNLPNAVVEHTGIIYRLKRPGEIGGEREIYWNSYNLGALEEDWSKRNIMTREIIARYYFHRAQDYFLAGDMQMAKDGFDTASLIGHNIWYIHYAIGRKFVEYGWFKDAENEFKKDIALQPYDGKAYNELGTAYTRQGQYLKAVAEFEKAIQKDPGYVHSYRNAGVIYYNNLKDNEKTLYYWKKYLELNPGDNQIKAKIQEMESI